MGHHCCRLITEDVTSLIFNHEAAAQEFWKEMFFVFFVSNLSSIQMYSDILQVTLNCTNLKLLVAGYSHKYSQSFIWMDELKCRPTPASNSSQILEIPPPAGGSPHCCRHLAASLPCCRCFTLALSVSHCCCCSKQPSDIFIFASEIPIEAIFTSVFCQ